MKHKIKFETIKVINGTKYISENQIEGVNAIVCRNLGIDHTEETENYVREAIDAYFQIQNGRLT